MARSRCHRVLATLAIVAPLIIGIAVWATLNEVRTSRTAYSMVPARFLPGKSLSVQIHKKRLALLISSRCSYYVVPTSLRDLGSDASGIG